MFNKIKNLLGFGPTVEYSKLVKEGAIILDVRSKGEYNSGHIQGSMHIPLDQLGTQMTKLKDKNKAIITCCASGMRSGAAKGILKANGFKTVYNGGSWFSLQNKI